VIKDHDSLAGFDMATVLCYHCGCLAGLPASKLSLAWQAHETDELAKRQHGCTAAPIKQELDLLVMATVVGGAVEGGCGLDRSVSACLM